MLSIIFAIILVIGGVIGTAAARKIWPALLGIVLAVVLILLSCVAVVPTGYTGILTTFGRVEDRTVSSGINFIAPWQRVVKMDNRTQKVQIQTSACHLNRLRVMCSARLDAQC